MKHQQQPEEKPDNSGWLTTYSDLMNNMLILFMMLYAMSSFDAKKFKALAQKFNSSMGSGTGSSYSATVNTGGSNTKSSTKASGGSSGPTIQSVQGQFDALYANLKSELSKKGYTDSVEIVKLDNYIYLRFKDGVLFYPDKATMKPGGEKILNDVGDTIKSAGDLVSAIEICGYTAQIGEDTSNTSSLFSWQLSADRSITVLKYLSGNIKLPESKMSIEGFSHYKPVSSNDTEAGRAQNRRAEIKLTRREG